MIKLFRNIRKKLLNEGKTTKYFKYAIGEILLVVIGILIALSINNWNETRKSIASEKRYVSDLIQDLKNDSINLNRLDIFLKSKYASKEKIAPLLRGNKVAIDSIGFHFAIQWAISGRFTPTSITIEELKNSGSLNIIRDINLRRQIVSLYNSYSIESFTEDTFNNANNKLVDLAGAYFKNIFEPKTDEIYVALEDNKFINGIQTNLTFTRLRAINDLQTKCFDLIQNLEKYKNQIDD
jgi:hypothetical protein